MPDRNPSSATSRPKTIYLDQNKWIDLARAVKSPKENPEVREVLELLCTKVGAKTVILPLTSSNIFETLKINHLERRFDIAHTQATLSESKVFRGSRKRLEIEAGRILSGLYGLNWIEPEPLWFLSSVFFEAYAEAHDPRLGMTISPRVLATIQDSPKHALFHYLMSTPDEIRVEGIRRFTAGCEDLRLRIEDRRSRHSAESLSMRRKIYSAMTAIERQDAIIAIAADIGLPWTCLSDRNGATLRKVVGETPSLVAEREISLKLEAQNRPIHLNDMRDMQTFCAVLPYADIVVAEHHFTDLARQAGLHDRFGVKLVTNIMTIPELL